MYLTFSHNLNILSRAKWGDALIRLWGSSRRKPFSLPLLNCVFPLDFPFTVKHFLVTQRMPPSLFVLCCHRFHRRGEMAQNGSKSFSHFSFLSSARPSSLFTVESMSSLFIYFSNESFIHSLRHFWLCLRRVVTKSIWKLNLRWHLIVLNVSIRNCFSHRRVGEKEKVYIFWLLRGLTRIVVIFTVLSVYFLILLIRVN